MFLAYKNLVASTRESNFSTSLTTKMLNLGAELPIFTQVTKVASHSRLAVGLGIGQCPEVAEGETRAAYIIFA